LAFQLHQAKQTPHKNKTFGTEHIKQLSMKMLTIYYSYSLLVLFIISWTNTSFAFSDVDSYTVVNDEVYLMPNTSQTPNSARSTATETRVSSSSTRDTFFDIFSNFEAFKTEDAVWATTGAGRRTLSKMKYLIVPIWYNDEAKTPADIQNINNVMQEVKQYYNEMSWSRHDITWEILTQVTLANIPKANPDLDNVAAAVDQHILQLGKQYPTTHTGIIIAYKSDGSGPSGVADVNGNRMWMSMPFAFSVTRHEMGHNYGHRHQRANTYDWRLSRGFFGNTVDGWDMMSGGTYGIHDIDELNRTKVIIHTPRIPSNEIQCPLLARNLRKLQ
jgi:hypothetical protein